MTELLKKQQEIENLRCRLHELVIAKKGDLTHPEVAELSAQLDRLIVEFERSKGINLKGN